MAEAKKKKAAKASVAAFGSKNRSRLIDTYFALRPSNEVVAPLAWAHVYRLLLWSDQTTGLAHCYESDKSQPGKNWYARSLAFHDWMCASLQVAPHELADEIDWLFRRAAADLAQEVLSRAARVQAKAETQRAPYEGRGFPKAGEDPELVSIVRQVLGDHLGREPSTEKWQELVQRIRQYLALDNQRNNLVGEGFEDVLAQVVNRTCQADVVQAHTRRLLHELPGFNRAKQGEKPNKVDVAILRPGMRTLVTVKWSVRADREKQFVTDFGDYVAAESDSKPFEYVFVTNEFDPARLVWACERLAGNAYMFNHVVHISTDAVKATYGTANQDSMRKVIEYIDSGRLVGLGKWLTMLAG